MTDPGFARLVERIEVMGREHPRAYRIRVLALGLLGHAYLFAVVAGAALLVLLLLALLVPGLAFGALIVPALLGAAAAASVAARAAWATPPLPAGLPLGPREAPRLHAMVRETSALAGARPVDEILLTSEVNAAVIERPRWHVLPGRRTLLLGLPLMHGLSGDELRAVVAHEMGHVAREHGRLGAWTWRVRHAWSRVRDEVERRGRGAVAFRAFARWYVPRFQAWSLALARAQEIEADQVAARCTSARAAADALTRLPLLRARLDREYWPSVRRAAREAGTDVATLAPHAGMAAFLATPPAPAFDERALELALAEAPSLADAHPPLAQRLEALGQLPRRPEPPERSAADEWLSAKLREAAARLLDDAWRAAWATLSEEERVRVAAEAAGSVRRDRLDRARERRAELERIRAARELEPSEAWEHAAVIGELEGPAAERPLLEALHARVPDHGPTCFELGRLRLLEGDASGVPLLEAACELAPSLARRARELLLERADRLGLGPEASGLRERLAADAAVDRRALAERERIPLATRRYRAHDLPPDLVGPLVAAVAAVPGARLAVLVERELEVLPERRAWLLGVERDPGLLEGDPQRRDGEIAEKLLEAIDTGGHLTCLVASGEGRVFLARLAQIPGATIWTR